MSVTSAGLCFCASYVGQFGSGGHTPGATGKYAACEQAGPVHRTIADECGLRADGSPSYETLLHQRAMLMRLVLELLEVAEATGDVDPTYYDNRLREMQGRRVPRVHRRERGAVPGTD